MKTKSNWCQSMSIDVRWNWEYQLLGSADLEVAIFFHLEKLAPYQFSFSQLSQRLLLIWRHWKFTFSPLDCVFCLYWPYIYAQHCSIESFMYLFTVFQKIIKYFSQLNTVFHFIIICKHSACHKNNISWL